MLRALAQSLSSCNLPVRPVPGVYAIADVWRSLVTVAQFRGTPRIEATTRWIMISFILAATAIALYGKELATSTVPTHSVVWGSLALTAYSASLLCMLGARQGALLGLAKWNLGSWMLLWYGLTFGLATVTWTRPPPAPANQIAVSSVLRALWLVAFGITFWAIGYCVGPGHLVRRLASRGLATLSKKRTMAVRSQLTPWVMYATGVIARVLTALTTGHFGLVGNNTASAFSAATGSQQILSDLSLLCPLAICAAALQVYSERLSSARITLAVLFIVELAFGAAAGGKQGFVIEVLAVAIPMSAARYRVPKMIIAGGILAFLVIIIPFNQAYRPVLQVNATPVSISQGIDEAPTVLRQVTSQNLFVTVGDSTTYLLQRIQEIEGPAIILQRTPGQIPFSSPVQLVETPLTYMVPRALWPGKPILETAYEFSRQYYEIPSTTVTASAISPIGDLYRHGGWIPVAVGMFIFGCGVRLLDDRLDIHTNSHAILLIILFFPSIVKGETDWVGLVAGIPATILFWLLATFLIFRPRSPG